MSKITLENIYDCYSYGKRVAEGEIEIGTAAKRDIRGTDVVLILANTFAEYLYNHIFHEIREIDYADFDDIIINHRGEDVSKYISNMTMSKFAANS